MNPNSEFLIVIRDGVARLDESVRPKGRQTEAAWVS